MEDQITIITGGNFPNDEPAGPGEIFLQATLTRDTVVRLTGERLRMKERIKRGRRLEIN